MNASARPWVVICLYCVSVLALIGAFVLFMRMQEDQSANSKLRSHGVVSRALVVEKKEDSAVVEQRRGRSRTIEYRILIVRHVPLSTVKFADFPLKVPEMALPEAPPLTGNPMADSKFGGVMFVPADLFEKTRVGDRLTVVNTPWDREEPVLVSEVNAYQGGQYYPHIAGLLVLMLASGATGFALRKGRVRREAA